MLRPSSSSQTSSAVQYGLLAQGMLTVKLVVIGASGVGKTSLRGQYITGQFSSGYRATIGADFISKTLPHPWKPDESVTLQIWDTAGQERFSSLSSAFFRGADAVILMFDVNKPETLEALRKWWDEFCERAPLAEEEVDNFCCAVVGNKTDLVGTENGAAEAISSSQAWRLINDIIPSDAPPVTPTSQDEGPTATGNLTEPNGTASYESPTESTASIDIQPFPSRRVSYSPKRGLTQARSRSSSRFYTGTMTTFHTTTTIYHTPGSSLSDVFHSARTSPEPSRDSSASSISIPSLRATSPTSVRSRRNTAVSDSSSGSDSGVTITPSMFAREQCNASALSFTTTPASEVVQTLAEVSHQSLPVPPPPPPPHGPRLFYTSAKSGDGVKDVFEYIAERVARQWEYEEVVEARRLHMREASAAETIRVGIHNSSRWGRGKRCCS